MIACIKNIFSKAKEAIIPEHSLAIDDYGSEKSHHNYSPAMLSKLKKFETHLVIDSIYEQAGLANPLIIWTQSPLGSYIAKAAIDVFSEADQPHPWYYQWWDRAAEGWLDVRKNAAQSILDSGWKMGHHGTGYPAWNELAVYTGRDEIVWKDIPPNTRPRYDRSEEGDAWTKLLEINHMSGDINVALNKCSLDMIVDMWARYKFQMDHIGRKPVGGSRNMHLRMMREKKGLLCQKNLGLFPVALTHPKTGETRHMTDQFIALRDSSRHIMPYTEICFVSEAADFIKKDNAGRLHCETGPALLYPDGFRIHSWHGVQFPEAWIGKKPETWAALRLRNAEQRRAACEMIGWDNVLKQMKAETINKDIDPEIGELVSLKGFSDIEEKFLRVRCGTGRDFVLPVPPEMRTAGQANAWTWVLEGNQYNPEVRT